MELARIRPSPKVASAAGGGQRTWTRTRRLFFRWRKEAGWLRYGTAAAGRLCVETATGYGRRQVGVAAWPAGEDVNSGEPRAES